MDAGASWWPLQCRELDAPSCPFLNQLELGLWILRTDGDWTHVLAADSALCARVSGSCAKCRHDAPDLRASM
jgi:benzoyl-CoA-dihydrodiol lyase